MIYVYNTFFKNYRAKTSDELLKKKGAVALNRLLVLLWVSCKFPLIDDVRSFGFSAFFFLDIANPCNFVTRTRLPVDALCLHWSRRSCQRFKNKLSHGFLVNSMWSSYSLVISNLKDLPTFFFLALEVHYILFAKFIYVWAGIYIFLIWK